MTEVEGKKILIVDDDPRNIFALKATLRYKGYDVFTAQGVNEALGILQNEENIHTVLMDIMMPDTDGYEAMSIMRKNSLLKHIRIIAVTAKAMKGDKEKCLAAGADNYISKPIDVEQLLEILNAENRHLNGTHDQQ